MELMISKLTSGFLLTWYNKDYKSYREAFLKESEMMSRVKELLKEEEGY